MESTYCRVTRCYTNVYDAEGKLVHGCVSCSPSNGTCVVRVVPKVDGEESGWVRHAHSDRPPPLTIDR